jgi:cellulose synthase/poly-beta-1,6-N-acetylglucosamine synthase-like glycosyltransferase
MGAEGSRRQWGAERITEPLPTVHPIPSGMKMALGRLAIVATILFWAIYVVTTIIREFINTPGIGFQFTMEAISYLVVVTFLTFSALMHLVARQGAMERFRDHRRTPRAVLDAHFDVGWDGRITVLVPSYVEEPSVVRKTLWSAALQEFPDVRVVLLIDDPPNPTDPELIEVLESARALPSAIEEALAAPYGRMAAAAAAAEVSTDGIDGPVSLADMTALVDAHRDAAEWIEALADEHPIVDHTDEFFVERVLRDLARELRLTMFAIEAAIAQDAALDADRVRQLHARLVRIFRAELTSFERKAWASTSHEPNKAMNLNAYLSLIGGAFTTIETPKGPALVTATDDDPIVLSVPESRYVLTLDADSMLLRDYCLRLVERLETPGWERVAVIQTPYSSYRGAPTRIERLAGATTDVQHLLHQGMTYYDATFWVGANAVIRTRALDDIASTEIVDGFSITTYIQDATVIEDTESSIDLGDHGWTLSNYPERLSYSATPPDFGSLVVQRRRWANGGLLILPKFMRQLTRRRRERRPARIGEVALRVNYLASITWATFGLMFLLAYPYDGRLLSMWVFLAAVPYFLALGSDLRESGHRFSDIFRIYGFNLVLLAVNLAGVLKSVQQAITGEKIPFARTPKVQNRTAAPGLFVLAPWLIIGFSALTFWRDFNAQNWGNAAFAAVNTILCLWALIAYIGIGRSIVDMSLGAVGFLFVAPRPPRRERGERRTQRREPVPLESVDWTSILYHGDRRLGENLRRSKEARRKAMR